MQLHGWLWIEELQLEPSVLASVTSSAMYGSRARLAESGQEVAISASTSCLLTDQELHGKKSDFLFVLHW